MANDPQSPQSTTTIFKSTLSIRARLMILAVLAIAPLLFDRIRLVEADRVERVAAAYDDVLALARQGVEFQQEGVLAARSVLQVIARSYGSVASSNAACERFLSEATADVPWIRNLSVVAVDGRVLCSTSATAAGLDLSDRPYFKRAFEIGDFVLSDYLVGRLRGVPTVVAALPTFTQGHTIAALIVAGIDLDWIGRLGGVVGKRPGLMALLIDGRGTVLASHPKSDDFVGRSIADHPLARDMLDQATGTVTTKGPDGVRRIFGYLRLPETDAHIAIGLDESEVLARVRRESMIAYGQLGFVCVIVLFGVWWGGERTIVQPIRFLARSAQRIGQGNLDRRLARRGWAAEFAPLATALDDMARKLALREEELHIANNHLEELASIDGLTGLANRRGFDAALAAEWNRAAKQGCAVALLMIDVDYFKLFNDTNGHVEGDECLRLISEVIGIVAAKSSCFPFRYGGEEFALLLPGADIEVASSVAEGLRQAVLELHVVNAPAPSGVVTVSVGVASLDAATGKTSQNLVEAADAALYAAKRRGRNTVVAHSPIRLSQAS